MHPKNTERQTQSATGLYELFLLTVPVPIDEVARWQYIKFTTILVLTSDNHYSYRRQTEGRGGKSGNAKQNLRCGSFKRIRRNGEALKAEPKMEAKGQRTGP